MRYSDTAVLSGVDAVKRPDGTFDEVKSARSVYVNEYALGAASYLAARSSGLHADAELQLRTCDYAGEQECVFHGTVYDVERSRSAGDFTVLTLKRRLRDA